MNSAKTIKNYFDELSSNSPTPGGGNVAALCGALAASLGTMVCSLTIGKKKYLEVEAEMMKVRNKLSAYQEHFLELAEKDNEAFNKVMDAFRLPKETETEKAKRLLRIEETTLYAAKIPMEVIFFCDEVLPLFKMIVEKGNSNSISDAGVAVLLLSASARGAYLNVLINCSSLQNNTEAEEILKNTTTVVEKIKTESDQITEKIVNDLKP